MTNIVAYALEAAGIIVFAVGYRRNRRNLMLVGGILLVGGDLTKGFVDGLMAGLQ